VTGEDVLSGAAWPALTVLLGTSPSSSSTLITRAFRLAPKELMLGGCRSRARRDRVTTGRQEMH
jgi:hypothetical protein